MKILLIAIVVVISISGCGGPDLSGLNNVSAKMADSLNTKYADVSSDFWAKVDGAYANSEKSTLIFDNTTREITIDFQDKHVHRSIEMDSNACPKNTESKYCYCEKDKCEYESKMALPCSSHLKGTISEVRQIKDPFGLQFGNLVYITWSAIELSYSNAQVEQAKENRHGSTSEQLKYYCESLKLKSKVNDKTAINLTTFSNKKVVWSSGSLFDLALTANEPTLVYKHE